MVHTLYDRCIVSVLLIISYGTKNIKQNFMDEQYHNKGVKVLGVRLTSVSKYLDSIKTHFNNLTLFLK